MTVIDLLAQALTRLTSPLLKAGTLKKLLRAILAELQELEDAHQALLVGRLLDQAAGVWLDLWGRIVVEPRRGRADDVYRRFIYAAILRNTSDGTPNRLLDILRTLTQTVTSIREIHPNTVEMTYAGTFTEPSYLRPSLQRAAPANVLVWPVIELGDQPFMLGDLDGEPVGSPLADLADLGPDDHLLARIV